jgi:hypothetical protein
MNHFMCTGALIWIAISGSFALSQDSGCANPNAPRIGLLIQDKLTSTDNKSSPQVDTLSKRLVDADTKFRDQLVKRLSPDWCIVTNREIFYDSKNFPQLKGSTVIEIKADASSKNPSVFAFAITVSSVGGIYAQDQLRLFTVPVLIETDTDFAQGADRIMKFWQFFGEAWSRGQKK